MTVYKFIKQPLWKWEIFHRVSLIDKQQVCNLYYPFILFKEEWFWPRRYNLWMKDISPRWWQNPKHFRFRPKNVCLHSAIIEMGILRFHPPKNEGVSYQNRNSWKFCEGKTLLLLCLIFLLHILGYSIFKPYRCIDEIFQGVSKWWYFQGVLMNEKFSRGVYKI